MSGERHEIQRENVGAYLLGALAEHEEQTFLRHLEECPVCSDEVARLRPAVDALPRSVTPIEPPPALKKSIMKVVETEARRGTRVEEVERRPRPLAAVRGRLAAAGAALTPGRPTLAWVGASFLLLIGGLSGYAATQVISEEEDPRALMAEVDTERVPAATASLTVSGEDSAKSAILRVHGMPTLASDRTYQVWIQRNGEVIPGSLFNVGQDGEGAAAVSEDLDDADAVLVTRERAGGARAPSETPILSVAL